MNRITFRNIIIFTVLISVSSLFGQNNNSADQEAQKKARENHQFRVAQRYQRSNQHENALRILKALYNDNVGSVKYYRALLETYLKMNMMEEAKQLIEQQKAKDTKNPRYEIDYGDVLYKSGEKERAKQTWDLAIQKYSANVGVYSILANVLFKLNTLRLRDKHVVISATVIPGFIRGTGRYLLRDCVNTTLSYNPAFVAQGDIMVGYRTGGWFRLVLVGCENEEAGDLLTAVYEKIAPPDVCVWQCVAVCVRVCFSVCVCARARVSACARVWQGVRTRQ